MTNGSRMTSVCVLFLAAAVALCCSTEHASAAENQPPTSYIFLIDASSKVDSEVFSRIRMEVFRYVAAVPRSGDHLLVFAFGRDIRVVLDESVPEKPARRGLLKELSQIRQVDAASLGPRAVEIVARQVKRHTQAHQDHKCRLYLLLSGEADSPTDLYRRTTDYGQIIDSCRKAFKQDDIRVWMAPLTKLSSSLQRLRKAIGADIPGNPAPTNRLLPPCVRFDGKTLDFGELTVDEEPVMKQVALDIQNVYGGDGLDLAAELKPIRLPANVQLSLVTDNVSCPPEAGEAAVRIAAGGEGAGGDVAGTIEFTSAIPQADIVPSSLPFTAKVSITPPRIKLAPEQLNFGDIAKPADTAPPATAQGELTVASLHKAKGVQLKITPTATRGRLPAGVSIRSKTVDCREEGQKEQLTVSVDRSVPPGNYRGTLRLTADDPLTVVEPTVIPYALTVSKLPAVTIEPARIDFGTHAYERQIRLNKVITVTRPPGINDLRLTLRPDIEKLTGGTKAEERPLTVELDERRKQFRVPVAINNVSPEGCEVRGRIIARLNTDRVALEPAEIPIQASIKAKIVPEIASTPDRIAFDVDVREGATAPPKETPTRPEAKDVEFSGQIDFGKVAPSPGQPATALAGLRVENIKGGAEGTQLTLRFAWPNRPAGVQITPPQASVVCPEAGRSIKLELTVLTEAVLEEGLDLVGTVGISSSDRAVKVTPSQVDAVMTIHPGGTSVLAKIAILAGILAAVILTLGFFFKKSITVEAASGTGQESVDAFYWPFPAMTSLEDAGYQGAVRYKQSGVQLRRAKGQATEEIAFGQIVELTNTDGNSESVRFRLEREAEEDMGTPEEPETL